LECGKPIEKENLDVKIPLCLKCDVKNWTSDPKEVYEAIRKDPELSKVIDIESPY
jgi:hypothetical protein